MDCLAAQRGRQLSVRVGPHASTGNGECGRTSTLADAASFAAANPTIGTPAAASENPVNYFNEHDEYAARWLANLIAAGHVAPGIVDTRSIEDVTPADLAGFTQCHFFAGIGIWSYALRAAGWADTRHVWTGSCPCQPFSAAGKGAGVDDKRHLWPHWQWLIGERKPTVILGEQVASKDAEPWFDLVATDLEGMGYACGAVPFPAAGVGAPNIRDRLYWMAHAEHGRRERGQQESERRHAIAGTALPSGFIGGLADTDSQRFDRQHALLFRAQLGRHAKNSVETAGNLQIGGLAETDPSGRNGWQWSPHRVVNHGGDAGRPQSYGQLENRIATIFGQPDTAGPVNGFWRDADWLACRDNSYRPVEPRTFPLVDGNSPSVGRLRADQGHRASRIKGYGNALNAEAAITFIAAAMECLPT